MLSSRDIRLMIIAMLLNEPAAVDKRIQQLEAWHKQRRRDIERYDKTEAIKWFWGPKLKWQSSISP